MIFKLNIQSKRRNTFIDDSEYYFDSLQTMFAWIKSRIDLPSQNVIDMAYFFSNGHIYIIENNDISTYYELTEVEPYTAEDI